MDLLSPACFSTTDRYVSDCFHSLKMWLKMGFSGKKTSYDMSTPSGIGDVNQLPPLNKQAVKEESVEQLTLK